MEMFRIFKLFILPCFLLASEGSIITLNNSVDDITLTTNNLTLRCGIRDTSFSSLVGRDVEHTDFNVQHVTSIIITRNGGEHVASVSQFNHAEAHVDLSSLKVTGDVSGTSGERGFLELTWKYPSVNQSGLYQCEVNAIDSQGHNIVYNKSVDIGVQELNVDDLVDYIHKQQIKIGQLEANQKLLATAKQLQDQINKELNNKIKNIMDILNKPAHTETGVISCGPSSNWKGRDGNLMYTTVHKDFGHGYSRVPVVSLNLDYIWNKGYDADPSYGMDLVSVTSSGFTIRCKSFLGIYTDRVQDMKVRWISLEQ